MNQPALPLGETIGVPFGDEDAVIVVNLPERPEVRSDDRGRICHRLDGGPDPSAAVGSREPDSSADSPLTAASWRPRSQKRFGRIGPRIGTT